MVKPKRPRSSLGVRTGGASAPGHDRSEDDVVADIARVLGRAGPPPGDTEVWIGDDAAVVGMPAGLLVLATDAVVAGVHADLSLTSLDDLGWKAMAVTLSDIGAVGGRPRHALVTLCLPPGTDVDLLVEGVAAASTAFECPVVGGDVTASAQVMVSVAATGVLDGPGPPVLRSGASPGDALFVTGPLGASAAGLRALCNGASTDGPFAALVAPHARPVPRLAEGMAARTAGASAMMDISDGLALDLHRLAEASGVGVVVGEVPVAPGADADEALSGGEDYELVIATPDPRRLLEHFDAEGLRPPIRIGRCTAVPGERLLRGAPFARAGWQHPVG